MLDRPNGTKYNRFSNLDGSEDRIIYWLLSPNNKTPEELKATHTIWRLLMYNDINAMNKPLPKYSDVVKLICNDEITQTNKRIFRSPHMEEAFIQQGSLIKIHIDSIIPQNEYIAQTNYGVEIICHNKIINVKVAEEDQTVIDIVDGIEVKVEIKSRVTMLAQAVLSLLNGADIAGVGRLQFNAGNFRYNQAQYGVWNNRNFEGMKIVIGALQSGLS